MSTYEGSSEHHPPIEPQHSEYPASASFTSIHHDGAEPWRLTAASASALEQHPEEQPAEAFPVAHAQEHQAEQPAVLRRQPENSALINEIIALPPAGQEQRLAEIAAVLPGVSTRTKAQAVTLVEPAESPLFTHVYNEALQLPVQWPARLDALTTITHHVPEAEAAWGGAVASAEAIGLFRGRHGFEKIAAGETDSNRLNALLDRAIDLPLQERVPVMRTLALTYLHNTPPDQQPHRYELVRRILERLPGPAAQLAVDEVRAGLTEYIAKQRDSVISAYETIVPISEPMKPYARLKIAAYFYKTDEDMGQTVWSDTTRAIQKYWHYYPPNIQKAIINDMRQGGQFDRAVDTLYVPTPRHMHDFSDRHMHQAMLLDIARAQAETDPSKGLAVLDRLQTDTEAALNYLARYEPEDIGDNQLDYEVKLRDKHDLLNRISGHRVAIHAAQNYPQAIDAIDNFTPLGDVEQRGQDEYISIVAPALAAAGHTADALTLAGAISTNDGIRGHNRQAQTYIKIAEAIRQNRLSAAAGN